MARDIRAFMAAFRAKIEEMEARIASNQRVLQRAVQAIAEIGKWINQKLGD